MLIPRASLKPLPVLAILSLGVLLVLAVVLPNWLVGTVAMAALCVLGVLIWRFRKLPEVALLVSLLVCALPGVLLTGDPDSGRTGLLLLGASMLAFLAAIASRREGSSLRFWSAVVVWAGVALAVAGPLLFEYSSKGRLLGRWHGLGWVPQTLDPNVLAGVLAMIVPAAVAGMLASSGRVRRGSILATVVLGAGLVVSESLAAILAVVLSCTLLIAWSRHLRLAGGLIVSSTAVCMVSFLVSGTLQTYLERIAESRLELWTRALYLFQELAFTGVGPGSFGRAANRLYPFLSGSPEQVYPHAHNLILEVAVEMGVAGLAAFAILVSICLVRSMRSATASKRNQDLLVLGFVCGVVSHLLHGLFDSPLWMNMPMPLLFLFLGVLAGGGSCAVESHGPVLKAVGGWILVTLGGLVAVTYSPLGAILLVLATAGFSALRVAPGD